MPATDLYRLALLQAYVNCPEDARDELSKELAHQRRVERTFMKIEAWTLIFVAVAAGFVACVAILLIANGSQIAGAITLSSDLLSLAGIALGRSYFIDKSQKPKELEAGQ